MDVVCGVVGGGVMSLGYDVLCDFFYCEVCYFDDKDWDVWLVLYVVDVSFWMLFWDDCDQFIEDLQWEILLIWYGNCGGLEDWVFCICIECFSVILLDICILYNLSNIELFGEDDGICCVCCNWYILSYCYKIVDSYFGIIFYDFDVCGESLLIKVKKVILKNDYVCQLIDVYYV